MVVCVKMIVFRVALVGSVIHTYIHTNLYSAKIVERI